jgi:hypothetical protein
MVAASVEWNSDLIFSHKLHVQDLGAECAACHEGALTSQSGLDDLLPEMETCYNCHDEDMDCAACHEQPDDPVLLPRIDTYNEKFNHEVHAENDIDCAKCHAGVEGKEVVTSGVHLPDMDNCMQCHQTPAKIEGCYLCHTRDEQLIPADHSGDWTQSHGMYSESGAQNCNSCHRETYCTDCHQGENLMNEAHPPNFIATHPTSYAIGESDCASCHQGRDYCIECHMEVNRVLPANHMMPDWNGHEHAREARANFDNCVVCHTENDMSCQTCHN